MSNLNHEIEAAKLLLSNLKDLVEDDDELRQDAIEGETNLFEAIQAAAKQVGEDEAAAEGLEGYIKGLQARKSRLTERAKLTRHAIYVAMGVAKRQKMETPITTVSVSKVPPSVNVTNEEAIPTKYWKTGDPKLDRKTLLSELKAIAELPEEKRTKIPGVELMPESTTIQLRFK